ncbi:hypothetical protein TL16_g02264 [Triparma laevis f. inornata]|uniref:Uncharacterized protein n=1 Tax=Triparma laevis f. inornata TaxID=1714386 RepID=A0A9W6ZTT7_9STRA|nr:hypothetical protein TL16_g02264 [Triparma laevis f. inornata]
MGQSSGNQEVTTERIKSHLQKFRLHRGKSANEFIESYDYWRKRLEEGGGEKEEDAKTDNSGEAAARADFGTQNFLDSSTSPDGVAARDILGDLTEAERSSEIGRSILSLSTVLSSLHGVILAQRGAGGQQTQKQVPQARNAWPGVQVQAQPQHQQNHHDDTPPPPVVPPFPNAPHHNQPAPDASNNTIQHNMHAHLEIQNQMRNFKSSEIRKFSNNPQAGAQYHHPKNHHHQQQHPNPLTLHPNPNPNHPQNLQQQPNILGSPRTIGSPGKKASQSPGRKYSLDDGGFLLGGHNAWDMAGADDDQLFDFLAEGGIGDI